MRIAALFNPKAKKWVNGRKGQFDRLKEQIDDGDQIIWFHCASLGEFEQGRPVIEAMRKNFPDHKILQTFFSPSGFEVRKDTKEVDYVFYLPLDTQSNARKFIEIARPRIAFFVKYEFWFNYINELSKNKIPTIVISAIFRPSQYIFKPWGYWPLKQLQKITHFFVQNEESLDLLNEAQVYHAEIGGDTRFDRVMKLASEKKSFPVIESFKGNADLIMAGSTWPADGDVLLDLFKSVKNDNKLIIAPHEISKERIDQVLKKFSDFNPQLYSTYDPKVENSDVLIINNVGLLSYLYRYAKIAYVGGGFGIGIHNLLEAATYGIPVIFGPNYNRFLEAIELIEVGGGYAIANSKDCLEVFNMLEDEKKYYQSCQAALSYVEKNSGATKLVVDKVKSYLVAK